MIQIIIRPVSIILVKLTAFCSVYKDTLYINCFDLLFLQIIYVVVQMVESMQKISFGKKYAVVKISDVKCWYIFCFGYRRYIISKICVSNKRGIGFGKKHPNYVTTVSWYVQQNQGDFWLETYPLFSAASAALISQAASSVIMRCSTFCQCCEFSLFSGTPIISNSPYNF